MKKFLSLMMCIPLFIHAQETRGVKWTENLSWQQIKEKAKAENKYIFVDCFATWCRPCKQMDKDVYTKDSVGNYINDKFISIKVQMDTSKDDNDQAKKWYADAHKMLQQFKITAFPCFLFFSPDGKIVHKGRGAKNVKDFIELTIDASNPNKQYYTLLDKYMHRNSDYSIMPYLANISQEFNENELALQIATYYMHNYLDKLNDSEFCKKTNLEFIGSFFKMLSSKDRVFNFYYHHSDSIDALMGDNGYSGRFINYIIYKEEITPKINIAKNGGRDPDWKKIRKAIINNYNTDYAESNILSAKVGWYNYKKNWRKYAKYLIQKVDKTNIPPGMIGLVILNNSAFDLFKYSSDKQELKKALSWSERAIQLSLTPNADVMDTKANLLYKLGRREEAITVEENAVKLKPNDLVMQKNLEKMKKGTSTWLLE